uniref:riboflavin kinase n=1 Tax=Caenorhabditis tropicalis TaxID=1561998 RepID=A0A1I7UNK0_9PELO
MAILPYRFEGEVVRGFGRGGKELGCPTANMDDAVVNGLPEGLSLGVYYGIAQFEGKEYKMAMSIGWNPQYHNEKKTLEIHLIDYSGSDFYGKRMSAVIQGFIREMKSFSSLDELKAAIAKDIEIARRGTTDQGKL